MHCQFARIALTSLFVTAVAAAVEPIFTEDFEGMGTAGTIPAEWSHFTAVRTVSLSDEQAHSGTWSMKLVDDDPKNAVGLRTPHLPVEAGRNYGVTWWFYAAEGQSQALYLEFWNEQGRRVVGHSNSSPGQGKWVRRRARATAPEGAVTLTVHLNSYSTNQATGWFDDIEVTPMARGALLARKPYPPAPVAHPCGLFREDDIARAKRNIENYPWATKELESLRNRARFWMDMPDDKLPYWIPDLTPFRVVDCPACGAGWRFAWGGDHDKLVCRKCAFTWPDPAYPESESETFPDPVGGTQTIPFYRGKPSTVYGSAQRDVYRLSGHLRHRRTGRLRYLGAVGRVYALTGEKTYAETVRHVLLRLAEVYPHYLPHDWNQVYPHYRNLQSGKLCGWKLTDAGIFIELATAYDLTYNSGVYSAEDKVTVEEGCFREFARLMTATSPRGCCINDGPTAMGAGALAGLMLGDHDTIAWAIEPPDGFIGFIEQHFLRDGHWYEASPSYEAMSVHPLYVTPEALRGYSDPPEMDDIDRYDNLDLLAHPLMKKILTASAYCVMPDGCLPPTNDSTWRARYSWRLAERNVFWSPMERNRRILAWACGGDANQSGDDYALFRRDPDAGANAIEPLSPSASSLVRPGAGWAILRTGYTGEDAAVFLDFGPKGSGHGHPDRLNIIVYDYGAELATDLGYLGWGHPNHPWLRATASHNQVIVNGKPHGSAGGELEAFAGEGPIQGVIASAPKTYPGITDDFRRHLILVNHGPGKRYVVDLFEVQGGEDHQYAFHGDGEAFTPPELPFSPLDAAVLGEPETGYALLDDIQAATTGEAFTCQWISDPATHLGLRLHVLGQADTQLVCAEANGLRNRSTPFATVRMHPVYVRRKGPANRFLTVIDPFRGKGDTPLDVTRLAAFADVGWCEAVEIRDGARVDIAVIASQEAARTGVSVQAYPNLTCHARMALFSLAEGSPRMVWALDGDGASCGGVELRTAPAIAGHIVEVDKERGTVTVDVVLPEGNRMAGQHLFVGDMCDGTFRIASVESTPGGSHILLDDDPILTIRPGSAFTIVPYASVELPSPRRACLRGDVRSAAWTTTVPGQVFLRAGDSAWTPGPTFTQSSTVRFDHSDLPSRTTWVALSVVDLARDSGPPALIGATSDQGTPLTFPDAGYQPGIKAIHLTVREELPLESADLAVELISSTGRARAIEAILATTGNGQWSIACALPEAMPDDSYQLNLILHDAAYNRLEVSLRFNTIGLVFPFRDLRVTDSNGRAVKSFDDLDTRFYRAETPGDFVEFGVEVPESGRYLATLGFTRYSSYGIVDVTLDAQAVRKAIDLYGPDLAPGAGSADLGVHELSAGEHRIRFHVSGRNEKAEGCFIGVCRLILRPQ